MRISLWITSFFLIANVSFAQTTGKLYFIPDYRFKGNTLTGWKPMGNAKWTAQDGEIKTILNGGDAGNILVMDRSFQDAGMQLLFKCSADNEAGVLLRLEKVAEGMKGILVSVKDTAMGTYRVIINPQGRIIQRDKLRTAGGIIRIAPPPADNAGNRNFPNRPAAPADIPLKRPSTNFLQNEWNQLELYIDANLVRFFLNDGAAPAGVVEEGAGGYGPIAL